MGIFSRFSKKDNKEEKSVQEVADYYTPVVEPVGELPVSNLGETNKFIEEPEMHLAKSEILFDDTNPNMIYTAEQKEYIDNGYYLSPSYQTALEFGYAKTNSDLHDTSINDSFEKIGEEIIADFDEELPENESDFNQVNQPNEENAEHKFFASSIDDIDNYKSDLVQTEKEKTKILGDASIFGISRIDSERR